MPLWIEQRVYFEGYALEKLTKSSLAGQMDGWLNKTMVGWMDGN